MNHADPDVIIVGAGPVGLTSALELSRFGIRSVVLERFPGVSWHPKCRNMSTRTMEIIRRWGEPVFGRIVNIDAGDDWKSPIRFLKSLVGEELSSIETPGFLGPGGDISPAAPVMSSQDLLEDVLIDTARKDPLIEVLMEHEVTQILQGFAVTDEGVEVEVLDRRAGLKRSIRAGALVAADGAESLVRAQSGVQLEGPTDLAFLINVYFRGELEPHLNGRRGVLMFVNNPEAQGVFQPLDGRGRWLSQVAVNKARWSGPEFDEQRCIDWIRAGAGVPDLEVEIVNIGRWVMNASIATSFVVGRTILVGDASHQLPPTGGFGVNSGMQGTHNAMWKLALWLRGEAGYDLVRSYHDERHPVACSIAAQTIENHKAVRYVGRSTKAAAPPGVSADEIRKATRRYGNHLGMELGACYSSIAVVSDGTTGPVLEDSYTDYVPSATPGARIPHLWLGEGRSVSTHDLVNTRFVLIVDQPGATPWAAAVQTAAQRCHIEIDVAVIGSTGLEDVDGRFLDLFGISDTGAVLIRPDAHVAWRSASLPAEPGQLLGEVLAGILASDALPSARKPWSTPLA
jgi:2-polyprenyl-6-methoxyphenol hydroxylase-like FAD-dependent oxidoreductase